MDLSLLVLFISVRLVNNTAIRMVYSYSETIRNALGIDLGLFSQAIALRFLASILAPLFSTLADRRGQKTGMLLGLGLFVSGSAVMVVWPSFLGFTACLILNLLGNITFIPAMQAFIGERVAYQRRGLVLALTEISWSLSFILGVPAAGLLIDRAGWQVIFPVILFCGLLGWLFIAWRVPGDSPAVSTKAANAGWTQALRTVFSHGPARSALLMGAVFSAANELVNITFNPWLQDGMGLQLSGMAVTAAVIGTSELLGEGLSAGLTDRLGKPRALGLGLVLNVLAALALPVLGTNLNGALLGLFLLYLTFEFGLVSCIPLMTELLPHARATLMAAFITSLTLGRAIGDLLGPVLLTWGFGAVTAATAGLDLAAFLILALLLRHLPKN